MTWIEKIFSETLFVKKIYVTCTSVASNSSQFVDVCYTVLTRVSAPPHIGFNFAKRPPPPLNTFVNAIENSTNTVSFKEKK